MQINPYFVSNDGLDHLGESIFDYFVNDGTIPHEEDGCLTVIKPSGIHGQLISICSQSGASRSPYAGCFDSEFKTCWLLAVARLLAVNDR
jgi:hypothetical protein